MRGRTTPARTWSRSAISRSRACRRARRRCARPPPASSRGIAFSRGRTGAKRGREILDKVILPLLEQWAGHSNKPEPGRALGRRERMRLCFGVGSPWDEEKVLDRYELLYEAGLVEEARRDGRDAALARRAFPALGEPMRFDHRRILATAIARLRGKLKYRPVVFELMPREFTLTELQRTVEAISGRRLHKQNFRRLVELGGTGGADRRDLDRDRRPAGGAVPLPPRGGAGAALARAAARRAGLSDAFAHAAASIAFHATSNDGCDAMTRDTAGRESADPSKARVFISYSRKDMAFADRLEAALKARGFEPLIDRTEIYAFEEWWKRIEALIVRADTVVFVLSPDSVASEVALKEVAFAASLNKRFAPIVCRRVDDKAVPEALARLNFVFFEDDARFEESADRLAEALDTDISWIRQHTEFGEQARRWASAGRPGGLLLRSPALEQAERWIAARPRGAPAPTDETQAYVGQSRLAATRRQEHPHRQSRRRPGAGARARRTCLLAARHRGRATRDRAAERGARQGGARPRHAQLQARAADRRKPGVRHRPGAARRAGHERRIGAQDPRDRQGDLRAAGGIRARRRRPATQPLGDAERIRRHLPDARGPGAGAQSLSGRARHRRAPRRRRSRQHQVATRPVGVVQQGRRRAGGAGQAR